MKSPDILAALGPVIESFTRLKVPYYIGGSVASSAYGIPRSTMDIDLVADLRKEQVPSLVKALKPSYYIDGSLITEALARGSAFNIIHLATMLKVDIFVMGKSRYDKEAFRRRRKDTLDEEPGAAQFYLVSPEDVILNKLAWYRSGGNASDRQWSDVLGVIKVQKGSLEKEYLRRWASELGLTDLLDKALIEAGIG